MSRFAPTRRALVAGLAAAGSLACVIPAATAQASSAALPPPAENGWVTSTLARMTLEEKVGQLFVQQRLRHATPRRPTRATCRSTASPRPAEVVQKYHLGGVIYFAWTDSVQNPDQIAGLSNGLQKAALSQTSKVPSPAADRHRPGAGRRHPHRPAGHAVPGLHGARRRPQRRRRPHRRGHHRPGAAGDGRQHQLRAGRRRQRQPAQPGHRHAVLLLRPDARGRAWSARRSTGYQGDGGVAASAKHFPGHGDTATDSHVAFPVITHTRERVGADRRPAVPGRDRRGHRHDHDRAPRVPGARRLGRPGHAAASRSSPACSARSWATTASSSPTPWTMQGVRDRYGDDRGRRCGPSRPASTSCSCRPPWTTAYAAVLDAVRVRPDQPARTSTPRCVACCELKHERGIVAAARTPTRQPCRSVVAARPSTSRRPTRSPTARPRWSRTTPAPCRWPSAGKKVLVTGYGVATTATLAAGLAAKGATHDRAADRHRADRRAGRRRRRGGARPATPWSSRP